MKGIRYNAFFLDGNIIVWPTNQNNPLRTEENYKIDVNRSLKSKNFQFLNSHGVKGTSILNELLFYNPVINTNIDYMHSILEGVTKRFFFIWFVDTDAVGSIKMHLDKINERLLNIRPPSFIPNTPRSIKLWRLWRAHEFLSFLLYYSLPVFFKLMEVQYYKNLIKFVLCMQNLLKKKIVKADLDTIQLILEDFVEEANQLYGNSIMHEIIHLVKCTRDFGPLNSTNSFPFEEINRKILRLIHGRDLVGEEFIKHLTIYQALENFRNNIVSNEKIVEFLDTYTQFKSSNKKKLNSNSGLKYNKKASKQFRRDDNLYSLLARHNVDLKNESEFVIVDRVTFKGVVYTDLSNKSKNCDSYISINNDYGLIENIIIVKESVYFVCRRLIKLLPSFHYN